MIMLMSAALLAGQPAPAPNPHAQHAQHRQHTPMQQGQTAPAQHEPMKGDCCKDCCKDMAKGEHDRHSAEAQPQAHSSH